MNNKKYISAAIAMIAVASIATAIPAFADTGTPANQPGGGWSRGMHTGMGGMHGRGMKPAACGTVTAFNGNTITVTGKQFGAPNAGTTATAPASVTYTIDATNAKVTKNGAAGTIASIAVGDTIAVQGTTASGTENIAATMIRDGMMGGMGKMNGSGQAAPQFTGNGEPVVGAKVTAISGSTLTITNSSNVTYTVDASNAKIVQGPNTIAVTNIAVGDSVLVQGTVNGTAIMASTVMDQTRPANTTAGSGTTATNANAHPGFFGGIKNFFSHIFGF